MSYWHQSNFMHLKNIVYIFYNKKLNLYKFGITEFDINHRLKNYCASNYYDLSDIQIIFSYTFKDGLEVESLLSKAINGKRVKLPNSNYYYKEHFREEQLENILNILESEIANENLVGNATY
jgi:hypothetical protein